MKSTCYVIFQEAARGHGAKRTPRAFLKSRQVITVSISAGEGNDELAYDSIADQRAGEAG